MGKQVVATDLPETKRLENVLHLADTHEQFLDQVKWALKEGETKVQEKIALAQEYIGV